MEAAGPAGPAGQAAMAIAAAGFRRERNQAMTGRPLCTAERRRPAGLATGSR